MKECINVVNICKNPNSNSLIRSGGTYTVGHPHSPHVIKADSPHKSTHISTLSWNLLELQWIQPVSLRLSRSHWRSLLQGEGPSACGNMRSEFQFLSVTLKSPYKNISKLSWLTASFVSPKVRLTASGTRIRPMYFGIVHQTSRRCSEHFWNGRSESDLVYSASWIDQFEDIWGYLRQPQGNRLRSIVSKTSYSTNSTHLIHAGKQ